MSTRRTLFHRFLLASALLLSTRTAVSAGAEKPAMPPPPAVPTFSELDKDGDGRLTLSEFKAGFPQLAEADAEKRFKSLDANGDGTLSPSEYMAGYPGSMPAKMTAARVKKPAKPPKPVAKIDRAKSVKEFSKLDKNGDGKLSLEEYKADARNPLAAEKKFRMLDKDHDGFLSLSEFQADPVPPAKKKP
jgi:hypothetical protein